MAILECLLGLLLQEGHKGGWGAFQPSKWASKISHKNYRFWPPVSGKKIVQPSRAVRPNEHSCLRNDKVVALQLIVGPFFRQSVGLLICWGKATMRGSIVLLCVLQLCWLGTRAHAENVRPPTAPTTALTNRDATTFSFALTDLTDALAKWSNQRLLEAIAKPEAMSYETAPYVWSIASQWVSNNQWAGRVRVNEPPQKDGINIYIVRRKFLTAHRFTNLEAVCPCEYLAGTNAIVCVDDSLKRATTSLDRFTQGASKDKDADDVRKAVRHELRTFMAEWIIAHEVGHLVLHHSVSDLRRSWNELGQPVGLDAERQADLFYLSHLQHQAVSQFSSFLGLAQLITAQYGQALAAERKKAVKDGKVIAPTNNDQVYIKVSPFEHPPMLLRALNLYETLISRYPKMVDSSGYVDRITSDVHPIPAPHADVPEFCQSLESTSDSTQEPLDTLAQYSDLYLYEGYEAWARSVIGRMQHEIETGTGSDSWKKLWRATIAEMIARVNWKFKKETPDWKALESINTSLEGNAKSFAAIQLELTRSFTENRDSAKDAIEAAHHTEALFKDLVSKNALKTRNDDDIYDVLSTYLVISFVPKGEMDEDYVEHIDALIDRIASLKNLDPLRRRIIIDTIRSFALTVASKGKSYRFAAARLISSLVTLSSSFGWPFEEIDYRVAEVDFLKKHFPQQHPVIANREIALGQMLPRWGHPAHALLVTQDALREIQAIDLSQASLTDRRRMEEWQLKVQNDIGWLLIANGKFDQAVRILETVLHSMERPQSSSVQCTSHSEILHVYQNIADAQLALGNWTEAVKFGKLAYSCALESPHSKVWYDAAKTLGLALYSAGQKEKAQKLLTDFVDRLAADLDDNHIGRIGLVAIANGKRVSVKDVIDVDAAIHKARQEALEPSRPALGKTK